MENTEHTEGQGVNRRSFIKRAAATGGVVVFAAPAIQTVVAGAARAGTVGGGSSAPTGNCCHSDPTDKFPDGGCKPACTSAGEGLGKPCEEICGTACPVGSGDCNPCSSDDYCDPACYTSSGNKQVEFIC